jgi:hypothetical protein
MPVKLVVIISLASFAAAFAAATWIYTADEAVEKPAVSVQSPSTFNAELPVEDRIRALEQAVSDERFARQLLQEEVFYLTSELERLSGDSDFGQAEESRAEQTVIRACRVVRRIVGGIRLKVACRHSSMQGSCRARRA